MPTYSQNYATDVLGKIDERVYLDSVTKDVINNGVELEFSNGNNAVTIYQMEVVTENDYQRSGTMRYGQLVELGNAVQTFVLSQDKSFAISIDRGNREDAKMVPAINEAVKRQVREVSVPTVDTYRLAIAGAYAVANSQGATAALTSSNTFAKILDQRAALQEAKVKLGNIVVFVTPTVEAYLWLDTTFKQATDRSTADKASGKLGTVMGMDVYTVPSTYLPANFGFLMMAKDVLIAPTKFNKIKTMDGDYFGIDGMVGFGRRYYDCFITSNSGIRLRYHKIA
jgi:hypothetical protein